MGRKRNPRRNEAFRLYIESEGQKKPKELADFLNVPSSQVRKWKVEDQWDAELRKPPEKRNVPKRRQGAPFGSKNALGNKGGHGGPIGNRNAAGHGAPLRNQNGVITGEYATIWVDMLSEEEKEIYNHVNLDPIAQIDETIQLLTIRERRMMENIQRLKDQKVLAEYEDVLLPNKADPEHGKPFVKSRTRFSKLHIDKIVAAEEALTRVQEAKRRAIETKQKLLKEREQQNNEITKTGELFANVLKKAWSSMEENHE